MEYTQEKLPQKVELMFQAVIDMINEGSDINTMKVQDITKRAGIGKGTAYEYFSSKEELIGGAIDWDLRSEILKLRQKTEQQETFRDKIFCILDSIEVRVKTHNHLLHMMGTSANSCCISQNMKETLKNSCYPELIRDFLDAVTISGIEEGVLSKEGSLYNRKTSLVSQIILFFVYLKHEDGELSKQTDEVKERIFQNILLLNR